MRIRFIFTSLALTLFVVGAGCTSTRSTAMSSPPVDSAIGVADVTVQRETATAVQIQPPTVAAVSMPLQISLRAGSYFFDPAQIVAAPGQQVQVTFENTLPDDTFVIDGLQVSSKIVEGKVITFTAPSTPGRWAFYSATGAHRDLGMEGMLIVQ